MRMSNGNATSYAMCLFDVAVKKESELNVLYDLREIRKIVSGELRQLFSYPIISKEQKKEIIDLLKDQNINELIINMMKILVDFNHITLFNEIVDEYTFLIKEENNIKAIDIIFAKHPSNENFSQIIALLEKQLDCFVVINKKIDPSIIGGIIIKYEGKEINNSVKKHLNEILKTV